MTTLRLLVGGLFVGHGTQKLFGWFGGSGPEGTGGFFQQKLGLRPGRQHAVVAGAAETGGGALLATGFLTAGRSTPDAGASNGATAGP